MRQAPVVLALLVATMPASAAAQPPQPPAGMDTYLFGILRRGDGEPAPPAEAKTLQAAHRENMERMAGAGLLIGAGPLLEAGDYRGIFIFKADRREAIDTMVQDDPLIRSGRLVLELLPWWGPEKIGERYLADKRENPDARDRMITYQLAFLRAGPNRKADADAETKQIQAGHMAHIQRMADAGQLVAAGPFLEEGPLRGVFVFRLDSLERAREVAAQDPAVKAGRLVLEIYDWMVADGVLPPPGPKGGRNRPSH